MGNPMVTYLADLDADEIFDLSISGVLVCALRVHMVVFPERKMSRLGVTGCVRDAFGSLDKAAYHQVNVTELGPRLERAMWELVNATRSEMT